MLKRLPEDISAGFALLLGALAENQVKALEVCAKVSLANSSDAESKMGDPREKIARLIPRWMALLEAERDAMIEVLHHHEALGASQCIPDRTPIAPPAPQSAGSRYEMTYAGVDARLRVNGAGYVLVAGSTVKQQVWPSLKNQKVRRLRLHSEADGTLMPTHDPKFLRLTRDLDFPSLSAAAVYVAGCSVSGPREWRRSGPPPNAS